MWTHAVSRLVGRVFRNRRFTWSILAVLMALMLVEWQSRRGYRQTLAAIEAALADRDSTKPLRTDEVERLLHGWAWQYTEAHGGPWYVGYRWPSLFRTYRIWLPAVGAWLPASAGQVTGAVITGELTADKLPVVPVPVVARQELPPNRDVPVQQSQITFDLSKLVGAITNAQFPDPSGFAQSSLGKVFQKCHKTYYQNAGIPEVTDEFIETLQSAAGELPKLELSTNPQEATWNHLKVFEGGIPFSAFRFSSTMDQPADLSWVFTGEESEVNWYILPARGAMSGFKDFRWNHFPRFQNPSVPCHETAYFQTLGGGEIKPGEDYIVYFATLRTVTPAYNPRRPKYAPLGLSIALRLLPTGRFSPNPSAFEIAELVGTPLYSSPGGEILCRGHTPVQKLLPTPNANHLILCDRENTFQRWDLPTKSIVREFHAEGAGDFKCAAISADGKRLATAADISFDVLIWDLENPDNQNPIKKVFVPWNGKEKKGSEGPGRVVIDIAFLKNHDSLFVDLAHDSDERWREAAQWSIADDREIRRTFFGQNLAAEPIPILGGEQLMVVRHSGDPQKTDQRAQWKFEVVFLDPETGQTKAVIPLGKLWAYGELFLSPDEKLVTLGLRDALIVLDCATHKVIQKISTTSMGRAEGAPNGLSVAWSPDSQLLAIACPDSSIQVWDVRQDRLVRTWCGHTETIQSLAFTSDGMWLASSSDDGTVRLWPREPSNLEIVTNSVGMKLIPLPEGELLMGSPHSESSYGTELPPQEPQHRVRITRPFYLGMHEVTAKQFRKFVEATSYKTTAETNGVGGSHILESSGSWATKPEFTWRSPGFPQTDDHPVVQVSWEDAQKFCKWLSDQEQAVYRLPTEAEWEYASRSEQSSVHDQWNTRFRWEKDSRPAQVYGNVADQAIREHYKVFAMAMPHHDGFAFTAPVGSFAPNLFGLYDMHGNVFEWCADWYDPLYYRSSPAIDPQGPMKGNGRVQRGGGFTHHYGFSRCDYREYGEPKQVQSSLGFRVVREVP